MTSRYMRRVGEMKNILKEKRKKDMEAREKAEMEEMQELAQ